MITQLQTPLKVMLIGDSCYDVYHYGKINRISPEAPVPIFDELRQERKLGMSQNVYQNMKNFGIDVTLVTKFSDEKHRYIDEKSMQQVIRVDIALDEKSEVIDFSDFKDYDVIVISDYDKGFITYEMIKNLRKEYDGCIFIDTKKNDLRQMEGCILKINDCEYSKLVSKCSDMIITYGGNKVVWNDEVFHPPKVNVHDVCGAGDTFLAGLVYGYNIYSGNISKAIQFAMEAATISVKHFGVYAPSLEEINNAT